MKKWMFTFQLFCLSVFYLQAQYEPMVGENRHWIFQIHWSSDKPGISGAKMLSMMGDTLISGQIYKKIYAFGLEGNYPCPGCFEPDYPYQINSYGATLRGVIREDTFARKVYYLPIDPFDSYACEMEEYELFDFSLQESDPLSDCLSTSIGAEQDPQAGLIDSIRTELLYGKNRRTLYTTGLTPIIGLQFFGPIRISEGIGFNCFGPFNRRGNLTKLIDFCEGTWEECQIISALRKLPSSLDIAVYPNPTKGKVWLETDKELIASTLYDALGLVVYHGRTREMDLSALPPGVYLWRVEFAGGEWAIRRLLRAEAN